MQTVKGPANGDAYEIECRWCLAVLACRLDELRLETDPRDGNARVLTCPHCVKETWFDLRALDRYRIKSILPSS